MDCLKKLLLHLKSQLCLGLWARLHKRHEQAVPGMRLTGKQNWRKEKISCQAGDGKGGRSGIMSKQLSNF